MPKHIKLMADYDCYPLWSMAPDHVSNINPETLSLSAEIKLRLQQWAKAYDETLNRDDPASSGFKSEDDAVAFEEEGMRLWQCLCQELGPAYEVVYFSESSQQLLTYVP